jgi:hypothetical protein
VTDLFGLHRAGLDQCGRVRLGGGGGEEAGVKIIRCGLDGVGALRRNVKDAGRAGKDILPAAEHGKSFVNVAAFESNGGSAGKNVEEAFTIRRGAAVFGAAHQKRELQEAQDAGRDHIAVIGVRLSFDEALHEKLL